tara:strand:- start:706 stop:1761 length:1056 start_codon:yes stop_codon:yes gene_type:complete
LNKTAVVLLNLGGPDSVNAIHPFLFNLFNDPAILKLPLLIRWPLAKLISTLRVKKAKDIYLQIGGKSPILSLTNQQGKALEIILKQKYSGVIKVFVCMRYWHPMSQEVSQAVKEFNPKQVVLLPLYPQFSTTTTGSAIKDWYKNAKKNGLNVPISTICCYPIITGLIEAHAELVTKAYKIAETMGKPRIIFSAHGLPKSVIQKGDPYEFQVNKMAKAIIQALNVKELDWIIAYQSKVGPLEWLGPPTEQEIKKAGFEKKSVVIVPVAFVSEHSETLVELDIEYAEIAKQSGVRSYQRVPAVATHPRFISALGNLVELAIKKRSGVSSFNGKVYCLSDFNNCPMFKEYLGGC